MSAPLTLDAATIEAIAQRTAALLAERGERGPAELVDAAEIARRFGISRATVYERADELGAERLFDGPRARLRFNPDRAAEALRSRTSKAGPDNPPRRKQPAKQRGESADLLPIRR